MGYGGELYIVVSWSGDGVGHFFRWPDEVKAFLEERGESSDLYQVFKVETQDVDWTEIFGHRRDDGRSRE